MVVGVFDLFRRQRHVRADVSLLENAITQLMLSRAGNGQPVPHDELPITQGLVTLLADAIADMDLYAQDRPSNDRRAKRVETRYPVLEQPDPDEDRADTLHKIVQSLFWAGNAWTLNGPISSQTGAVDSITVMSPDEIGWLPDPRHSLKVSAWTINGARFEPGALGWWKINDNPRKGPLGRSPVQVCATALDTYGWAYRYLSDFYAQGGNPASTMRSQLPFGDDKLNELIDEWITARQARRPAFLPSWLEYDVPASSGEIEQTIRALEFAAAEFARMCNVPVSLVNAPVAGYTLQYSNVGDEFKRWLALSLRTTWMRRVERGFSAMLPPGVYAKLDAGGLFPEDDDADDGQADPADAVDLQVAA